MHRRTLLRLGLVGGAALTVAGATALWWSKRAPASVAPLNAQARNVLGAWALGVLDGALPADKRVVADMIDRHLDRVEAAVAAFSPTTRQELTQLLAILANPLGRRLLVGLAMPWESATVTDLQAGFDAMRRSRLTVRKQAFMALRDLTNASFYAEPGTWATLGYPGPRPL